jgi:hypothetical protein
MFSVSGVAECRFYLKKWPASLRVNEMFVIKLQVDALSQDERTDDMSDEWPVWLATAYIAGLTNTRP